MIFFRTAYQSLHKVSNQARQYNYIVNNGVTHSWVEHYRNPEIRSNQTYVNEWNQMDDILSHRSDSPHLYQQYVANFFSFEITTIRFIRLSSDEETIRVRIHVKLKEIMLQVDLDEVTSKVVRSLFVNRIDEIRISPLDTREIGECF